MIQFKYLKLLFNINELTTKGNLRHLSSIYLNGYNLDILSIDHA